MIQMIRPLFALLLLSACASTPPEEEEPRTLPTPEECAAADWYEGGQEDALAGLSAAEGVQILGACPWPDAAAREAAEDTYLAGHARGTAIYCSPPYARDLARRREAPALSCPAPLEEAFRAAYARGLSEPEVEEEEERSWSPRLRPWLAIGIGTGGTGLSGGLGVLL